MLGWVVDAVRHGRADDLYLIPTSIAYDQIQDVKDYAAEARGGEKKKESFGWALEAIRSLRRRYGNIHVRFAEPISVAKEIDLAQEDRTDLAEAGIRGHVPDLPGDADHPHRGRVDRAPVGPGYGDERPSDVAALDRRAGRR
jgi:hypothetical protein